MAVNQFDRKIESSKETIRVRKAARIVIFDDECRTPIINVRNGEFYKIPGGGIEEGEDEESAAKREAAEESGSDIEILERVSEHEFLYENPKSEKILHHSVCFLARLLGDKKETNFDDWEQSNNFQTNWVTYEDACRLFESSQTKDAVGRIINERDYEFLKKAKVLFDARKK